MNTSKSSYCEKCETTFLYDEESSVNVKYYDGEANARGFTVGGLSPICPLCENGCPTEESRNYSWSRMKVERKYIPIVPKVLGD